MGVFASKLGPLFVWQAVVLVAAFAGAAAIGYVGLDSTSNGSSAIADDETLIPATIGDLITTVSTDGNLSFPEVETALFETGGTVGEVMVVEGDIVAAGDPLAQLNDASIADIDLDLARAKVTLRDAETKLADALAPADALAVAKAEADIAKAEQALEKAHKNHDTLAAGATDDELADARQAIASAETSVSNATTSLGITTADWAGRVTDAQTLLDDASAAYAALFDSWLGVAPANIDTTKPPAEILAALGVDLATLFPGEAGEINFALLGDPRTDDPATLWNEATVYSFLTFYPGLVVGVCASAPLQGSCVSSELDDAWTALDREVVARDSKAFDASKAIDNATTAVSSADDKLTKASDALVDLLADATTVDLDVTTTSLAVAEADLAAEQTDLADLLAAPDERDLDVLRGQLASAEIALANVTIERAGATLIAPIGGVVTEVDLETGDNAQGNQTGGITIVDESIVEIAGTVDEIDVLFIREGSIASVSLSALPGQALRGTITEIDTPTNNQGVVEFPVSITIDVPDGLDLREGLTATASVLISQKLGVLRVPTSAINGSFLEPFVRVSTDDGLVERPIDLGSSDDFWVVVTAGLTEGEEVVMPAPSAASAQFGNIQFGAVEGFNQQQLLRQLQGGGGGGRRATGQNGGGNGGGGRN